MDKSTLKKYARKFLKKAVVRPEVAEFYKKLDQGFFSERTFFLGSRRMRADCLQMESAPGTAETVMLLLNGLRVKGKVLDFGCGIHKGGYLRALGLDVHGCDILDLDMPNYTKIDPQTPTLPFADNEFEAVVISEVIEHVESPFSLLLEIFRITKGHVLISTPNPMSLKSRKTFYKTGYLHWFTPENLDYHISPVFFWQIQKFCKTHGFDIVQTAGNHEAFGLADKGSVLDLAESLIVLIKK